MTGEAQGPAVKGEEVSLPLPLLVGSANEGVIEGLGGTDGSGIGGGAAISLARRWREMQRWGSISGIQLYDGAGKVG